MNLEQLLKDKVTQITAVSVAVDAFEEISQVPIDSEYDDLMFETGIFPDYSSLPYAELDSAETNSDPMLQAYRKDFVFDLTRQFKNDVFDDEFMQLKLSIHFPPKLWNKFLYRNKFSHNGDANFFLAVKRSMAFRYISKHKIPFTKIEVTLSET